MDRKATLKIVAIASAVVMPVLLVALAMIFRHELGLSLSGTELAAILEALAWPATALLIVFLLRDALRSFFLQIALRAKKLGAFNVEIELSDPPTLRPFEGPSVEELREPTTTLIMSDSAGDIFRGIESTGKADYVIIDLGTGKKWLTSRVYITAEILRRMKRLKAVVFISRYKANAGKFLGLADPEKVRWCLARAYPWLESAYVAAYGGILDHHGSESIILSCDGDMEPHRASMLVSRFIDFLQRDEAPVAEHEWTELPRARWEHAEWITDSKLSHLLGTILSSERIEETLKAEPENLLAAVLAKSGDYVAMVDEDGRFSTLVDRAVLIDELGKKYGKFLRLAQKEAKHDKVV